jgi:uncharacterized coiled-coil protein SlyX
MDNALFQIVVGVAGAAVSFIAARILQAIRDLEHRIGQLNNKISELEVLVARQHVTHAQFDNVVHTIFNKIDKIDDKLDHKVDK